MMHDAVVCGLTFIETKTKSQATTETGSNFEEGDYVARTTHI